MTTDNENPGVALARSLGVDIEELHTLLRNTEEYGQSGAVITLTENQIKVLRACVEVACEF